jgi:D-alanine-D-alanine ligase
MHIAVLMGGWSSEREVSLNSGKACAKALQEAGYRVTALDVDHHLAARLLELQPDIVFNALHGVYGEDGVVQGLLESLSLPYTHSGVLASALAMDKAKAKAVMKEAGLPVAEHRLATLEEACQSHLLPPPYVVKPVADGSSFGIAIVREGEGPATHLLEVEGLCKSKQVMVENYVAGMELTCAVMGDKALDIIEICPENSKFYDYQSKYAAGGSRHILPARLSSNIYLKIQDLAYRAHHVLGCRGISRADFRFDADHYEKTGMITEHNLICMEVNTQPGMTQTSLVPEMAAHAGYDFVALVRWMIEDASCNR